jgi:hypothetical protein
MWLWTSDRSMMSLQLQLPGRGEAGSRCRCSLRVGVCLVMPRPPCPRPCLRRRGGGRWRPSPHPRPWSTSPRTCPSTPPAWCAAPCTPGCRTPPRPCIHGIAIHIGERGKKKSFRTRSRRWANTYLYTKVSRPGPRRRRQSPQARRNAAVSTAE